MRTAHAEPRLMREALLALLVVALTFLNFGHSSAVFAAGGRVVVTGHSICGEQTAPNGGDHFTCHACRPDATALPPPPQSVESARLTVLPVRYSDAVDPAVLRAIRGKARARGPPSAA